MSFVLVFESAKFVLTKKGMLIGKGNADDGMLKFKIIKNKPIINDMNNPSTFFFDSCNV